MPGESHLNVYILGPDISGRVRERLQAQVQTALRRLPRWTLDLLRRRLDEIGAPNLPLIVQPLPFGHAGEQVIGFGDVDGRPAVRLLPRVGGGEIDWGADVGRLMAKAVAYLVSPPRKRREFWSRWRGTIEKDGLRSAAARVDPAWRCASDLDLFIEMFAAFALEPHHARWRSLPAVRAFLKEQRS
jgi:hypothetical protein